MTQNLVSQKVSSLGSMWNRDFGTGWHIELFMESWYNSKNLCEHCCFSVCDAKLIWYLQTTPCQYPQTKRCWFFLYAICTMRTLGHLDLENYAWRLGIVKNLLEYCWFFLNDFLGLKCHDTPTHILLIDTRNYHSNNQTTVNQR